MNKVGANRDEEQGVDTEDDLQYKQDVSQLSSEEDAQPVMDEGASTSKPTNGISQAGDEPGENNLADNATVPEPADDTGDFYYSTNSLVNVSCTV
jgi:hypothetical protein